MLFGISLEHDRCCAIIIHFMQMQKLRWEAFSIDVEGAKHIGYVDLYVFNGCEEYSKVECGVYPFQQEPLHPH